MPVNMMAVQVREQVVDDGLRVFGPFAAGHEEGRTDQPDLTGVGAEIIRHALRQIGLGLGEGIFQHHERFARPGQHTLQQGIGRGKDVFGEKDAQLPANLNGALQQGHAG